ncbi:short-chain dehydrogenase [Stagonosporopsis vannaccii]|nr:short-chain dehydrogenase [Stagonosporopsis vannaccii]
MSATTYLVTGANRGIGKGLTASLLQRPNTTVVAGVRDPTAAASILNSLPTAAGSKVVIVKIDSQSDTDAKEAVLQLTSQHGITSIDFVIANAGIANDGAAVAQTTAKNLRDHFNTNAVGPMLLFQAVKPLLQSSKSGNPVFLGISTIIGSMGAQDALAGIPPIFSPYGSSKAALNWLVRRLHYEESWLTSYVTHPGLVLTDMASNMFESPDQGAAMGAITVEVSVSGILKTLDSASREISGTFQNVDGTTLPW